MDWQKEEILQPLLACSRIGVVSDFDGTLSYINPDRTAPMLTPRNHELLTELTECLPLVSVISGRSADDLRGRIHIPNVVFIGNHGLERLVNGKVVQVPKAKQYREAIRTALEQLDLQHGMSVEDKGITASIHYRHALDTDAIFETYDPILREIATEYHLDYFNGKMIFELRPPLPINKGTALRDLVEEYKLDGVVFMGDDTTDADALKMIQRLRQGEVCYALGVGVCSEDVPDVVRNHSDIMVESIPDVEDFLDYLLKSVRAS